MKTHVLKGVTTFMLRRMKGREFILIIAALLLLVPCAGESFDRHFETPRNEGTCIAENMFDEFPKVMWLKPIREDARNGEISVEKTLQALHDIGANTFIAQLGDEEEYHEFLTFLDQSKDSGIKIWAKLPPNCEDYCHPFGDDYEAWAGHFAVLSLTYPHFEAFTIDDMHPTKYLQFTPAYVEHIIQAAKSINPNLKFLPTWYFRAELELFEDEAWKDIVEQTFMWYWASFGYGQEEPHLEELEEYINGAIEHIHPAPFMTGLYSMKYGKTLDDFFHPSELLKEMLTTALQRSDGIAVWEAPLFVHDLDYFYSAAIFQQSPNDDPAFEYKLGLSTGPWETYHGWYQAITTHIIVPENADVTISFNIRDTRNAGDGRFHFKQLVVNDDVLWDRCVEEDGTETLQITSDLPSSERYDINIRLLDKRKVWWWNLGVYVGDIHIEINGDEIGCDWTFTSGLEDIEKYIEVYDMIQDLFSPPEITTESLPDGSQGCPYDRTVEATGGCPPYSWSVASGRLAGGLHVERASGTISGEPGEIGTFTFTLTVTDGLGYSDAEEYSLSIGEFDPIKGDANGDCRRDILDVAFAVNIILDLVEPSSDESWCADCNGPPGMCDGDGDVDILDATKIVNLILGLDACH